MFAALVAFSLGPSWGRSWGREARFSPQPASLAAMQIIEFRPFFRIAALRIVATRDYFRGRGASQMGSRLR